VIAATSQYASALVRERLTAQDRAEDTLPLPFHGEVGNGRSRVDNINSTSKGGGTNADYLTARIARDRPDILERMQAGAYQSVRAGALARRCTADASYHYLIFKRCGHHPYSAW